MTRDMTVATLIAILAMIFIAYSTGYEDGEKANNWIPTIPQVCDGKMVG